MDVPKNWNLIKKPPYHSLNFTQNCPFQRKNSFLKLSNTGVKKPFLKISRLNLQKLLKSCWANETGTWLRWIIFCWVNFVTHSGKAAFEILPNPHVKVNSTSLCGLFNKSPAERLTSCQTWVLRSKLTTWTSLKNCSSTLALNLVTSHQVDYLSSALVLAEAVENNKEHLVTIRYSQTSLV